MKTKRKIKKYGRVYNRGKINLLENYGPSVRPCGICGYPTLDGYCCTYCGGDDTATKDEEQREGI